MTLEIDLIPKIMSKAEYEKHIQIETELFGTNSYEKNLIQKKNKKALNYLLRKFSANKIKSVTGKTMFEFIIDQVNKRGGQDNPVRFLSLGCGSGVWEMMIAKKFEVKYTMDCIDINKKVIEMAQQKANSEGFKINFIVQDINYLNLPKLEYYDIIFANGSLHHMINHERIANVVKKTLKSNGVFIVNEPIPKNGFRMWDETKKIANMVWKLIPDKYKYNHIGKNHTRFFKELPDIDLSKDGFECIRSEDLVPILKKKFITKLEILGFSFARRFVGPRFGSNYDIQNNPFDKALVDTLIKLDEEYTRKYNLKAENIFLVLQKS